MTTENALTIPVQLACEFISGRPMLVTEHLDGWDAFVAAWLPGTEGQSVVDVSSIGQG